MNKKYISFDVEASGRSPGKYSMLSLGACLVDDLTKTFYKEIKPISSKFINDAMKIGCLRLHCLKQYKNLDEYNPSHSKFNPSKVLELLDNIGEEPTKVMQEYNEWILDNTKGYKPIEAAAPIKFDASFSLYYFDNYFEGPNPFVHSGEDMHSFYRGIKKDINASIKDLNLRDERGLTHNALEDAIQQAKEFKKVLSLMK